MVKREDLSRKMEQKGIDKQLRIRIEEVCKETKRM